MPQRPRALSERRTRIALWHTVSSLLHPRLSMSSVMALLFKYRRCKTHSRLFSAAGVIVCMYVASTVK